MFTEVNIQEVFLIYYLKKYISETFLNFVIIIIQQIWFL
jgi:hypothetical protein